MNKIEYCSSNEDRKRPSKMVRIILIFFGTIFLAIGFIGIFLPLLPTTPLLLLTAACYARASDKFYKWLICNRIFGSYVKNYREEKGVAAKAKLFTILLLWTTILYSAFFVVTIVYIRILLIIIAIAVTVHILTIKTLKNESKR